MPQRKKKKSKDIKGLYFAIAAVALCLVIALVMLMHGSSDTSSQTTLNTEDNQRHAEDEFYMEDGFLRCRNTEYLVGIDVSAHQGVIDWEAVKATGVEFAIVRIGYRGATVGELYEDEEFRANLIGAREAGLSVGAYFFSQALNEEEAIEEAVYICELLDGFKLELPIYFDWEVVSNGERVQSERQIELTKCAAAFCAAVEERGYDGGVYFNQTQGYLYYDLSALEDYSLWLAEYGETPTFSGSYQCLQYSDAGIVDGISVEVDLDLMLLND